MSESVEKIAQDNDKAAQFAGRVSRLARIGALEAALEQVNEGSGPIRNGRHMPYKCPAGKLTIGYGRNLEAKGLSPAESLYLLSNDLLEAETHITRALPWVNKLDDVRYAAILDMCFNLGIGGLLEFKQTLDLIKAGAYQKAAERLRTLPWAKQTGKRADRIISMFATGQWPKAILEKVSA